MNHNAMNEACCCHDPGVFGHTNCSLSAPGGEDPGKWRAVPRLQDPQSRPDPDGMTWIGAAWVRMKDLVLS